LFADRLQHALLQSRRHSNYEFAVLLVDIDEFKVLNDSLGRSAGDELLLQVAQRLAVGFRDTDTLSRPAELDSSQSRDENTSGSARRKCGTCWLENDCMAESLQALYLSSGSSETLRLSN